MQPYRDRWNRGGAFLAILSDFKCYVCGIKLKVIWWGKNLAQKTLSILISSDIIIIGATNGNDDAYGRNDDTRKFDFGDENDADVESDTQGSTY